MLLNLVKAPRLNNCEKEGSNYNISVLIPVRNEEKNIVKILDSLHKQTIPIDEIIVYNDFSDDSTLEILKVFQTKMKNLKVIDGVVKPEDWFGKNWGCYQLSLLSKNRILVFLDADVELSKNGLKIILNNFTVKNVKLLSVFPTQKLYTISDYFVVPLMNWILLTFLPLHYVYIKKNKSFSAANGQVMVFDREVYFEIDGHRSVKEEPVEDMELIKLIKGKGYKTITYLGNNNIFCKMYENINQAINGFSKNYYNGFKLSSSLFLIFNLYIFLVFFSPIIFSFFYLEFIYILILIIFHKIVFSYLSNQNILINIILHPVQMFLLLFIGIKSIVNTRKGNLVWKGRILRTKKI